MIGDRDVKVLVRPVVSLASAQTLAP